MLKFFFHRQPKRTPELTHNEQSDPYLEKLIQDLLSQKKIESEKSLKQKETKEIK